MQFKMSELPHVKSHGKIILRCLNNRSKFILKKVSIICVTSYLSSAPASTWLSSISGLI